MQDVEVAFDAAPPLLLRVDVTHSPVLLVLHALMVILGPEAFVWGRGRWGRTSVGRGGFEGAGRRESSQRGVEVAAVAQIERGGGYALEGRGGNGAESDGGEGSGGGGVGRGSKEGGGGEGNRAGKYCWGNCGAVKSEGGSEGTKGAWGHGLQVRGEGNEARGKSHHGQLHRLGRGWLEGGGIHYKLPRCWSASRGIARLAWKKIISSVKRGKGTL